MSSHALALPSYFLRQITALVLVGVFGVVSLYGAYQFDGNTSSFTSGEPTAPPNFEVASKVVSVFDEVNPSPLSPSTFSTSPKQIHHAKQHDSAQEGDKQRCKAEIILIDGADTHERGDQQSTHVCTHDADDDIQKGALSSIGSHDLACKPSNNTAENKPEEKVDHGKGGEESADCFYSDGQKRRSLQRLS
jgi:hypothetical protein